MRKGWKIKTTSKGSFRCEGHGLETDSYCLAAFARGNDNGPEGSDRRAYGTRADGWWSVRWCDWGKIPMARAKKRARAWGKWEPASE